MLANPPTDNFFSWDQAAYKSRSVENLAQKRAQKMRKKRLNFTENR